MDQNTLVEGGDQGLVKIAAAFQGEGFPVQSIYLVKRTTNDGTIDWVVPVVLSPFDPRDRRRFIEALVRLREEKKLPFIDPALLIEAVPANDEEASRVVAYAARLGDPPIVIRDVSWNGLFIEYALVARFPGKDAAAA